MNASQLGKRSTVLTAVLSLVPRGKTCSLIAQPSEFPAFTISSASGCHTFLLYATHAPTSGALIELKARYPPFLAPPTSVWYCVMLVYTSDDSSPRFA